MMLKFDAAMTGVIANALRDHATQLDKDAETYRRFRGSERLVDGVEKKANELRSLADRIEFAEIRIEVLR